MNERHGCGPLSSAEGAGPVPPRKSVLGDVSPSPRRPSAAEPGSRAVKWPPERSLRQTAGGSAPGRGQHRREGLALGRSKGDAAKAGGGARWQATLRGGPCLSPPQESLCRCGR